MSTNLKIATYARRLFEFLRGRSARAVLAGGSLVLLAVVAYGVWAAGAKNGNRPATVTAQRGPLVISLAESGTIQNRQRAVVKSEVEGMVTILYLIAEGTHAKKGDLLLELDSSRLLDEKNQQQITVLNSEAGFIRARENVAVTKSQTDSDIAQADLKYRFAEQDLKKYLEGEHPREVQKAGADIDIANEELQRAADKLVWSNRLADEGYITRMELKADELASTRAKIGLDLAKSAMGLLESYTHQRNLDQLTSDVEQAKEALGRTTRKAAADMVQAEVELKAKESEFERQKAKLEKIDEQIAKCRIASPVDGMVVYSTTGQASHRHNVEPLEEGQQVRERQDLIYLPTDAAMMAEVRIHESSLRKVHEDMPVRVTVDAVPGQVFWGRVGKIGLLPDAQSAFMNPDLKVYSTEIYVEGETGGLRPGMTCRAEIIVEQYADAIYVPVQSIGRVGGQTVAYVQAANGFEPRAVQVGLDNNRMIRIIEGLREGESVLLAPPMAPSAVVESEEQQARQVALQSMTMPAGTGQKAPAAATETQPASQPASQPAFDRSKLRQMSPEERRKYMESLTPQQREELRRRFETQGTGRRRSGPPEE